MNKRIIYKNDNGGVSIIIPSPNVNLTIDEIAAKDVPPKEVFTQTGTKTLTQPEYDNDPEYWDNEGVVIGEEYPVGKWRMEPRPYKIVDASEIPSDRTARNLWDVDEADLTDGVGQ